MTGVVCDHYNSCLVTPHQTFPSNFQTAENNGLMNCVSYVPSQQGGFVVGANYNFSDGYSIDPCCNTYQNVLVGANAAFENNDFNYRGDYNFSNDYSFAEGLDFYQNTNIFPTTEVNVKDPEGVKFEEQAGEPGEPGKEYFQVTGTEVLPEGINEDGKGVPLTPSFFASNAAFKRIPIHPGRKIFRRRRPGDCASEWSNAFDKDYDDGFYWSEEAENN